MQIKWGRDRAGIRWVIVAAAGVLLAGCQSPGLRPFDGAVGYTFASRGSEWRVSYTDRAGRDWSELEMQALAACARETGQPPERLHLANLTRNEFARDVPVPVSYPAGVVNTPISNNGGMGAQAQSPLTFTQTEQVIQRVSFRQVTAVCQAV
ncbi:hypothetical protein EZI54_05700 [Marinobacter halodurans]|uniref:Uncharacterized protein n=1 Tax=Marinobacter halodurans TaxID=2528979 RepID=A0ABY1ZND4_9GAMM|nr:hypothetical protein [Marinobacter halodurans]TBW57947.1 hypothetical protein EZI54_05700 [Marinobacter halodurans]